MASGASQVLARLPPLPTPKELLRLYRVHAVKALSQNFLFDTKLSSKFVSRSGKIKGHYVCEIGPGPGNITRSILHQNAQHVIAIEKDQRFHSCLALLQEACNGRLSIVLGDILHFDMGKLFPSECTRSWEDDCPPINLIGNLPFNVSLPLICQWMNSVSESSSAWKYGRVPMTLTFQEEVAVRIVAPPGHSQRCRLSALCQNWCEVNHKFTIPGRAFVPKPDVDVGVVTLVPRIEPLTSVPFKLYEKILRHLFNTKQKHCKTSLKKLFPVARRDELTAKLVTVADVDPTITPVHLTMDEITRLALAYCSILEQYPNYEKYDHRDTKNNEKSLLFEM